ncbi:oligosaccharide flippase family protein [Phenylobacterium sp.]|uniref:oligosaccharide flippase family protein n=1 Tax=Phenylobacterium sp. TaxID=1871053 RepID=UPI002BF037FE|nr:oligosaccharide flippase family protein [Phenylobacterium sp.]HVI33298.1 oligosaccharide flippase family protein [Phenylobacterium sp.]
MSIADGAAPLPEPGRKRAFRLHRTSFGALALTGASALRLGLQFAMLPILARLIGPAEYGLVALAMPFILLANVLSDGGMGYALGRQREVSRDQESTVFWLSAAIGLTLALACAAAAWPMGALMDQPRLPLLIVALSPILLINSLTTVANGRIIREGRFAIFAAGDLISTVASALTALAAALAGWGAWALVAQQLVLWICKLAWVSSRAGAPIRLHYRFQEARKLLTFGAHTIGAILADFVSRNLDSLIVGGVLGATALGYYAMAYQIVRAPDMLISGPFYLYIFTAVARTAHGASREAMQDLAAAALRLGAFALAPLFVGLALVADLAVTLVLGDKWLEAIAPLRFLAAAGFFFCVCSIVATTFMGLGRTALRLKLSILLGVVTIATVAAVVRFGLEPVSAAAAGAMAVVCAVYLHVLARELKMSHGRLAAAFVPAALGCAAMAAAVLGARAALSSAPPGLELAGMIALGAVTYAAVIWLGARRRLMADLRAFGAAQALADAPVDPAIA